MKTYEIAAAMMFVTAAGCATTRMPPTQLTDARQALDRAKEADGAELVLVDLHHADRALERAEHTWKETDDKNPRAVDLAYIAARKAETAQVRGSTARAQEQVDNAQKSVLKHHAQTSAQRKEQLTRTEGKLEEADAAKRDAMSQLQEHNGRSVKQERRGTVITIADNLLFESNTAKLMPAATKQLDDIAESLKSAKGRKISIAGHADASGPDKHNDVLSQRRAEAVMQFFVNKGLPANEIQTIARGASEPIAENDRAEGRASNRRVQIIVHAEKEASQEG